MGRDEFQAADGRRLRLGKVMLDAGRIADSRCRRSDGER